jgi:hypothetical protein
MRRILCIFILLLAFTGCSPAETCGNSGEALRILFIGNSYTYVNDLPGTFAHLACSGGHKVETGMAADGGWTLEQHASASGTLDKLNGQQWDYVVLQEQSEIPAVEASRGQAMYPAARALVAKIRENGAEPLFFNTWGHKNGLPEYGEPTYFEMQAQLDVGYKGIARELGVDVVPVGYAWLQARTQPQPLDLWQDDGSHPNQQGTYLVACVFYATVFQESPAGLGYRAGVSMDEAETLQRLANDAVLE